jgi:hypothetical protein
MQELINDYKNLMKIKDLCKKYNKSTTTIYNILNKYKAVRGISKSDNQRFISKHNLSKELLYKLYITEEKTIKIIASELNKKPYTIRRLLHKYGIQTRSLSEHLSIKKYNEAHGRRMSIVLSTKSEEFSKSSKAMWEKWGNKPHPNLLIKMQSKEYKENMREVTLQRHKTEWHDRIKPLISTGLSKCWANNTKFRDKISSYAKTLTERVKSDDELYKRWHKNLITALNSPEYKEKKSIIVKKLWLNKEYWLKQSNRVKKLWKNDEYRAKLAKARANQPIISSQQLVLYDILNSLNIKYVPEYNIGPYSFDCFIPDHNILIEVNGDYWHSLPKAIRNDKSKSTFIERYYPNLSLKYIWEHEFKCKDRVFDLIKYWCKINSDIISYDVNDITMCTIDTTIAKSFLESYHYTNKIGNNSLRLGFFINDKLIAVIVYGCIVRNETATRLNLKSKDVWELSRLCIHPSYQIKNCASKIISLSIKYIKNNFPRIKMLISFADLTFNHFGTVYKASNWILDGIVDPSYWYVDKDGWVMHKKTLYDHAISLKMKETEFAYKYGYKKVTGMEKSRYIYKIDKS